VRLVEGAAVLSERGTAPHASCALSRAIRCFAFLLLLVVGAHLSYGVSPLMASRCGCAHGPEVPCDCPHHVHADGSQPPPCHIHAKSHRAAERTSQHPCVRARCGTIPPDLVLVALVSTYEPPQLAPPPAVGRLPSDSPLRPPDIFIFPSKHPPKASA
jgi:hypothetical protein